jgi:bacteriorhodopsin
MPEVTLFQYSLIYNAFSFTLAAMAATTLFLWISRGDVAPAYRIAVTVSGVVTAIAAYHYWRIFNSWEAAYDVKGGVVTATGYAFNDAYRYVDWLLTVPLLLVELVLVMRLDPAETSSKALTLGFAAALMIVLGYPGEIATDIPAVWVPRSSASPKPPRAWSSRPACSPSPAGASTPSCTWRHTSI